MGEFMWMELAKAADTLAKDLLSIKKGENVLIYGDTMTDERVVKATASAIYVAGGVPVVVLYETRPDIDIEPPKPLAAAMKNADVICEFAKMYLIHTKAYREALAAGARALCLSGMDADMMIRCMGLVNYPAMVELGEKLLELTQKSKEVKVTTPSGTDLTFRNNDRPIFHFTGVCDKAGESRMLGGQVGWGPVEETINGTMVIDGSIWPPVELGLLKTPIKLTIEKGRIVKIEGGVEAKILEKWLASFEDLNMYNLAHVCYGFNPDAKLTGKILEDERVFGIMEWGIGHQVPEIKGKAGPAKAHTDGVMLKPTIWLNGEIIEKDGEYVHPELAQLAKKARKV